VRALLNICNEIIAHFFVNYLAVPLVEEPEKRNYLQGTPNLLIDNCNWNSPLIYNVRDEGNLAHIYREWGNEPATFRLELNKG